MASAFQTLNDVYTDVRYAAGKDSTTIVNSDLLRLANKYYLLMMRELVDLNEDLYAQISSTALVANQREYPLPSDNTDGTGSAPYGGGLIKLQRVEVSFDNVNWYVGSPISLQEIDGPTILDTDINQKFQRAAPRYWFKDRSVWIAPVPQSTDAGTVANNTNLRIYWIQRKKELSATTDIPNIPKDFLGLLTEGMLIDVFRKFGRTNDMKLAQINWNSGIADLREKEQSPDTEQPFIFKMRRQNFR